MVTPLFCQITIDPNWVLAVLGVLSVVGTAGAFLWKSVDSKLGGISKDLKTMGEAVNGKLEGHTREIYELKGRFDEMTRDR